MPVLIGPKIRLQPMVIEDASSYLSALGADAEEVFEFTGWPPRTLADAEHHVMRALADRAHNIRLPYSQFDVATGSFAGTTSLYDINPALRTLGIGYTWLARAYWRNGHNTESKLLLLDHAFDVLGAARVVWHTDILNLRSQAAIARLGATREGVLRKHRIRADGTWRDTVQFSMTDDDWSAVRHRLTTRLAQG
jgi:RimJ/RimL family protein N-acetyltransferase